MTVDSPPATAEAEPVRLPAWRRWPIHATFVGVYVVLACYLFSGLWAGILSHGDGYLTTSSQDQYDWEWFFAVTARALTHGDNLLLSTLQGHPLGVNMMANTAMFGLSIPLAPVTLIFGPTITWALVLTLGMAASAGCWYWLMVRHLGISPVPAAIGAAFAGFAPPIVSHANAHPNLAVFFRAAADHHHRQLLKMRTGEHRIRNGVILGLLVTYQLFLGEEALLMAALGIAVFAVAYAVVRPRDAWASARQLLPGIGISLAVFVPLVAYPLWFQFAGPQSYDSLQHGNYGNDLAALVTFPSRALAGDHPTALAYAYPTEENSFFGWPLVIVFLVVAVLVWRVLAARALVLTTLAITVLSLGATVAVHGHDTGIPMPWAILGHLPLFESMLDSRLTMICVPTIGILLAVATDLMLARTNRIKVVWSIAPRRRAGADLPDPAARDHTRAHAGVLQPGHLAPVRAGREEAPSDHHGPDSGADGHAGRALANRGRPRFRVARGLLRRTMGRHPAGLLRPSAAAHHRTAAPGSGQRPGRHHHRPGSAERPTGLRLLGSRSGRAAAVRE